MARVAERTAHISRIPRRFPGLETVTPAHESGLAEELAGAVGGEVRFDEGSRATYSTDASNYRQVPIGVIVPKTIEDVMVAVDLCRKHRIPITSRGGGTSLAGQACNRGVIIDFSKYLDGVVSIDPVKRRAVVEPGCVLDTLREEAGRHGLTFGPDPATHDRNTIAGMLGNNSCGAHSVMSSIYGPGPMTVHQVIEMEVMTYDGLRFTVGAHDPDELDAIISSRDDPRGRLYGQLRSLRDDNVELIRRGYPHIPRRASGYNLEWLLPEHGFHVARALVGTEGTCVVILSATVELIDAMPERTLVVLGYPDAATAADRVPEVLQSRPVALEGIDEELVGYMRKKGLHPDDVEMLPEGGGWLLVEFGADTKEESRARAEAFVESMNSGDGAGNTAVFQDQWEERKIWQIRESGLGATAQVPGMERTHPGWEDAAVPPDKVGDYLRGFRRLLNEFGYEAALYGHFGQGCVHCRIDFDFSTEDGVEHYRHFVERAARLVTSYGGSLSGEHGDGQARGELLSLMYGDEVVEIFRRFKSVWDPNGMMNPGKVVDPLPIDQDLREGPAMKPVRVETHFSFPADQGDFAAAVARCVGVGKCRDVRSGTMCPSYMATREEEDSTRGRARLLFEMLQGDPITDLWKSDAVREALDLCLACKGCKTECPVNVDMATYKAEFLSHYYERRLRPRVAYSMGLIYWWSRIASHFPRLVNFLLSRPGLSNLMKKIAGVSPRRRIPPFSEITLTKWFGRRVDGAPYATLESFQSERESPKTVGTSHRETPALHHRTPRFSEETFTSPAAGQGARLNPVKAKGPISTDRVLLWPDTFNNYLEGSAGPAAVRVLEAAGYEVVLPDRPLCCGRPLYDYGMLDRAKALWYQVLDSLEPQLRAGIPIVGLEPSCVAAFKDELPDLVPDDSRAHALSEHTHLFSEFLSRQGYEAPKLKRHALVQGHCHHKAVMHMDAEVALLEALGLDYDVLDSGCCGMAGSFGFDERHYEVSMRIGGRVLIPAVKAADPSTFIIANGFSCRQQIEQSTHRRAMHVAQAIELAMEYGPGGPEGGRPEDALENRSLTKRHFATN